MPAGQSRTFVKLDKFEKEVLEKLREAARKPNGKLPTRSAIIKGVIRDYWRCLHDARHRPIADTGSDTEKAE